jgi:lactosylceramide 4-alpha-galactosyltransferase
MDLDIVSLKSLDHLGSNYAGAESDIFIAVGVLNLEGIVGREIAFRCVRDLRQNFDSKGWGNNGPGVITRIVRNICGIYDIMKIINTDCKYFRVMDPKEFYLINYFYREMFFDEKFGNTAVKLLEDNNSTIAHMWNKGSSNFELRKNSTAAYIQLAKKFCPKTLAATEEFF